VCFGGFPVLFVLKFLMQSYIFQLPWLILWSILGLYGTASVRVQYEVTHITG
jgi:hypothetical protein